MKRSEIVCRHIRLCEYAIAWRPLDPTERPGWHVRIDNTHNPEFSLERLSDRKPYFDRLWPMCRDA